MNISRYDTPADCISFDPRLAHVDCMIEASYEEQSKLWQLYAEGSSERVHRDHGLSWKEDGLGKMTTIGVVDGLPLCVNWFFAVIAGSVMCFYDTTSLAKDTEQVERWAEAICQHRVSVSSFGLAPRHDQPSPNVALYEGARSQMLERSRVEAAAKYAEQQSRLAAMTREPEVLAMIEAGIPAINDELLAERAAMIRPVVERDEEDGTALWYVEPGDDLRGVSFSFAQKWQGPAGDDLVAAKQVYTLHTFSFHGFFKPSVAEVLAQAPGDLHEYVAFSVKGPDDVVDLQLYPEALNAGYHVATTTYYRRRTDD